jgi:drug/metabolite transporter (DMT)-like permease
MNYVLGIFVTLISKLIIGVANVLDGKLSRKTFSSTWSLVVVNGVLILPVLPLFYIILQPKPLTATQFYIIIIVAAIEVFYQIPYYEALRKADTSIVISLFNIEKILVPILAYFVIGERLKITQYVGFGVIILCSILTTFSRASFKLNKAIYYMTLVSFVLAIDSVLQKYSLENIDWKSFYFWITTVSIPFYLLILLVKPSARKEVANFMKAPFKRDYVPLYGQNFATWIAEGLGTLALSLLPVTVTKAIGSFHAVIVHLIASKGHKGLQLDKGESLSFKRICLFVFLAIGVILAVLK